MVECPFTRISKLIFSDPVKADTKSKQSTIGGGHFMMQSMSTVEKNTQRQLTVESTESEHPDLGDSPNGELQSIIVRQPVSHST